MTAESAIYRPGVGAIVRASDGRIFLGERDDLPGVWQFPQGGRLPGESAEAALARELCEETSLLPDDYRVVARRGPYRYLFPPGRTKEGYRGQEHYYFLVDLTAPMERVNVATAQREFRAVRWIVPAEFSLPWVSEMKREPYRQIFRDFFGLEVA
ncbi:MAG: NUDIX domain-containing protein [Verrucomicrobia bacterium]|nr:NUDIX domain-containing protein [Verrucomicrobiota bacterium]